MKELKGAILHGNESWVWQEKYEVEYGGIDTLYLSKVKTREAWVQNKHWWIKNWIQKWMINKKELYQVYVVIQREWKRTELQNK